MKKDIKAEEKNAAKNMNEAGSGKAGKPCEEGSVCKAGKPCEDGSACRIGEPCENGAEARDAAGAAPEAPDLEVVFIIDRSGSMGGLEDDTIGGFNSTLAERKARGGNVIWSTVLFDHEQTVLHDRLPIAEVAPISRKEYWVRGTTAMLDAVGGSISFIRKVQRYQGALAPKQTLFVITSDGMENSSVKYTYRSVKSLISSAREQGWEFLFLGANIDAEGVAESIGIDRNRAARFINDSEGIEKNYEAVSAAMACMSFGSQLPAGALEEVRKDFRKRGKKN